MKKQIPGAFTGPAEPPSLADRKPRLSEKVVYFGDTKGNVYSYNPLRKKREEIAKVKVTDKISCMAELGGILYFGSSWTGDISNWTGNIEGPLYSYNPATGEQEKVTEIDIWIKHIIAHDKLLYFGNMAGHIYSYDPATKKQEYVTSTIKGGMSCMTAFDDALYFGDAHGNLSCYNLKDRKRGKVAQTAGINCIIEHGGIMYSDSSGKVYSYNPKTKKQKRVTKVDYDVNCMTAIDATVYASTWHYLHSYNPKRIFRKQRQVAKADDKIKCMTTLDGVLYYGSGHGLFSFNPTTKKQALVAQAKGAITCAAAAYRP